MEIKNVVVIGGGVLGSQIAYQAAYCGFDVTIWLRSEGSIGRCQPKLDHLKEVYHATITLMDSDKGKTPQNWAMGISDYEDFDKENCLTLMNRFKLDKGMKIKEMSKGMKEKFQLSLVMSRKAKLYILDEPIAGVDPAAREVILDVILNNYEEDALVLISTHLISDLETIFDDVVFLKDGEIVLHQSTEDLRLERKQSIDEAFREVFRC